LLADWQTGMRVFLQLSESLQPSSEVSRRHGKLGCLGADLDWLDHVATTIRPPLNRRRTPATKQPDCNSNSVELNPPMQPFGNYPDPGARRQPNPRTLMDNQSAIGANAS
jgi:hypothetical protein